MMVQVSFDQVRITPLGLVVIRALLFTAFWTMRSQIKANKCWLIPLFRRRRLIAKLAVLAAVWLSALMIRSLREGLKIGWVASLLI